MKNWRHNYLLKMNLQKSLEKRDEIIPWVNLCALGVNFLVFVVLCFQTCSLKESVDQQKEQVELQRSEFSLERRPYLYVELRPVKNQIIWKNGDHYYGGGDLLFENVGKVPATIIDRQYIVRSEINRDTDLVKWFETDMGRFSDVKSVMPQQHNLSVPLHPQISGNSPPKLLYIGALISYVGAHRDNDNRKYWTKFTQLYVIKSKKILINGKEQDVPISLHLQEQTTEWDENKNEIPIDLENPKWDELLGKPYIKELTNGE